MVIKIIFRVLYVSGHDFDKRMPLECVNMFGRDHTC